MDKRSYSKQKFRLRAVFTGWFSFSFLLSLAEAKSGVYPFGLALLCGREGGALPIFLGVFASGFFYGESGVFRSLLSMAVFGVRWFALRKKRRTPLWLGFGVSLLVTGAIALREFTENNALFESSAKAIGVFSTLPLFCLLFSLGVKGDKVKRDTGVLAWVYAIVKAFSVLSAGAFAPALAVGGFLTLYFAREGAFFGGVCGFVAGMAAGVVYMPVLGIAGLSYGIFYDDMKVFAAFFAASLSVSSGVYLASLSGVFPEFFCFLAGYAIFAVLEKKLPKIKKPTPGRREKGVTFKKFSAALSALSEAFYITSPPPLKSDFAASLKGFVFSTCDKCADCGRCGIDKYDLINHLTELSAGRENALPGHVLENCSKTLLFTEKALSLSAIKQTESQREARLLTEGYSSVARLLCAAGERAEEENLINQAFTKKAAAVIKKLRIPYLSVTVKGRRRAVISVTGTDMSRIKVSPSEIRNKLSYELGCNLSLPEFINREGGAEMVLKSLPAIRLECAKAEAPKEGECVSGDTVVTFENDSLVFYSLLADGMGSGREASVSSRLAALVLEKLIAAGGDKKEAISMLNKLLLVRKSEVYTTVDLLEIDRISGKATLIKAGAAPTYLCREGKCYKLESTTPPAGVISDFKVTQTSIKVKKGDWFIMISDGVIPKSGSLPLPAGMKTAASYASSLLDGRNESKLLDDMSVCVIRAF